MEFDLAKLVSEATGAALLWAMVRPAFRDLRSEVKGLRRRVDALCRLHNVREDEPGVPAIVENDHTPIEPAPTI